MTESNRNARESTRELIVYDVIIGSWNDFFNLTMPDEAIKKRNDLARLVCYFVPVTLLFPLSTYWSVTYFGDAAAETIYPLIIVLSFLLGGFSSFGCLILLFFARTRNFAKNVLISTLIFFPFLIASLFMTAHVRHNAFVALAERSRPLISAIKRYEKEKGTSPPSLESLVPKYLARVPGTGMSAYPSYKYELKPNIDSKWRLMVDCPSGMINWDEFYYEPEQNYQLGPVTGGRNERIGDWIYFHE